MYVFLASEMMLFGAFLVAVYGYRVLFPEATRAAAQHLKLWLGGINTAVLLTSSLFAALAVASARAGSRRLAVRWLVVTAGLGAVFLGIKAFEYWEEYT